MYAGQGVLVAALLIAGGWMWWKGHSTYLTMYGTITPLLLVGLAVWVGIAEKKWSWTLIGGAVATGGLAYFGTRRVKRKVKRRLEMEAEMERTKAEEARREAVRRECMRRVRKLETEEKQLEGLMKSAEARLSAKQTEVEEERAACERGEAPEPAVGLLSEELEDVRRRRGAAERVWRRHRT